MLLSILRQNSDRATLPLIDAVKVTHGRHYRSVPHQLLDLHDINAGIGEPSTERMAQVMESEIGDTRLPVPALIFSLP